MTPVLPFDVSAAKAQVLQRDILDRLVAQVPRGRLTGWYYTPVALRFSDHIAWDVCIYDCMEEFSAFEDAPARLVEMERRLLKRADVVFTGGQSLFDVKRSLHRSVFPFPSSVDVGHFKQARSPGDDPADQAGIPHPRVGYFGAIDERLDVDLVAQTARAMQDVHFVMIGPVVKIDPANLPQNHNLHWLGTKSYDDLPDYLRHWKAGWMPFALNAATRYINPTKTPAFLAAGLPVVSTAIVDVVRSYGAAGLVQIVDDEDITATLRQVLAQPQNPLLAKIDARLADMSWTQTWAAMSGHVERAYATKNVLPFRAKAGVCSTGCAGPGRLFSVPNPANNNAVSYRSE
ncbi:glycosyltransferase [Candidatus Phyllobacterium onerii]|uniref:glycosyltransferase n=1 Tax=Candidatus Phyllobacterium onerii TaxID=3020828 RepID=UPI00232EBA5D|nr:glycosyltransferase [Phyllobacterium sp. IY22]